MKRSTIEKNKLRRCPGCGEGTIPTNDLSGGHRCSNCHEVVEIDLFWSVFVSALLLIIAIFSFNNSMKWLGLLATLCLVVRDSGWNNINAKYFPLKIYKNRKRDNFSN